MSSTPPISPNFNYHELDAEFGQLSNAQIQDPNDNMQEFIQKTVFYAMKCMDYWAMFQDNEDQLSKKIGKHLDKIPDFESALDDQKIRVYFLVHDIFKLREHYKDTQQTTVKIKFSIPKLL